MKLPPNDCLSLDEMNFSGCFVCLFRVGGAGLIFWEVGFCLFVFYLEGTLSQMCPFQIKNQEEIAWYLKSMGSLQKGGRPSYSPVIVLLNSWPYKKLCLLRQRGLHIGVQYD